MKRPTLSQLPPAPDVTITWEDDPLDGVPTFPTVHFPGGITWHALHGVDADTDQVDGNLSAPNGHRIQAVDLWFIDSPDIINELTHLGPDGFELAHARSVWENGSVYGCQFGAFSLFIPGTGFTDDLVLEAFRRFNP